MRKRADQSVAQVFERGEACTHGLVGYWPMREGGGISLVQDLALGRHASLINGVVWAPTSRWVALGFDGTAAQFTSPHASPRGFQAFSCEVWVYIDQKSGAEQSFVAHRGPVLTSWRLAITAAGNLMFEIITTAIAQVQAISAAKPGTGLWHHVVATWDGSGASTLYINGTVDGTAAPTTMFAPTGAFELGASTDWVQALKCKIAQARLWSRCLSLAEVRRVYSQPFAMLSAGTRPFPTDDWPPRRPSILRTPSGGATLRRSGRKPAAL